MQWSCLCWNLLRSRHKLIITLLLEAASCIINVCWREEWRLEKLLPPGGPDRAEQGRGTLCAGSQGLTLKPVAQAPGVRGPHTQAKRKLQTDTRGTSGSPGEERVGGSA